MMTIIAGDHDETTRKKGGVLISYDHNDGSSRFTREPGWLISLLFRAKHSLPQKVVSIHHCFVNASGLKLSGFHLLQSMSDLLTRARTKIHTGKSLLQRGLMQELFDDKSQTNVFFCFSLLRLQGRIMKSCTN